VKFAEIENQRTTAMCQRLHPQGPI